MHNLQERIESIGNARDRLILKALSRGYSAKRLSTLRVAELDSFGWGLKSQLRRAAKGKYVFSGKRPLTVRRIEQISAMHLGMSPRSLNRISEKEQGAGFTREYISPTLLDAVGLEDRQDSLIFSILCNTGCRVSELVKIRRSDIGRGFVKINRRRVPVRPTLAAQWKKGAGEKLVGISVRRIQQRFAMYSRQLGIRITPGILRNSFIYRKYSEGMPGREIEKITGIRINRQTHGII